MCLFHNGTVYGLEKHVCKIKLRKYPANKAINNAHWEQWYMYIDYFV